jgi:hypothetical protein
MARHLDAAECALPFEMLEHGLEGAYRKRQLACIASEALGDHPSALIAKNFFAPPGRASQERASIPMEHQIARSRPPNGCQS